MCTLIINRSLNSKWSCIIGANRDEYFERPSKGPGNHWKQFPNVYAGMDVTKGGSWLGINKSGLFAAILNRKTENINDTTKQSRGHIVINALSFQKLQNSLDYVKEIDSNNFNPFNLILGDYKSTYWIKNENSKRIELHTLPSGFSMIDGYNLNDINSPKYKYNIEDIRKASTPSPENNNWNSWIDILSINHNEKDNLSKDINVHDKQSNYGTRSSSLLALPNKSKKTQMLTRPIWLYCDGFPLKKNFKKLELDKLYN